MSAPSASRFPVPRHWTLEDTEGGIRIQWRARPLEIIVPMVVFVFLGAWLGLQASALSGKGGGAGLRVGQLVFWPFAIAALYTVCAKIRNSTVAEVNAEGLTVLTGPLPWFGSRDLSLEELQPLELKRQMNQGRGYVYKIYGGSPGRAPRLICTFYDEDKAQCFLGAIQRGIERARGAAA